ncbi:MAG: protein-L-isoaspartate(D-aspartate) O-methyltransferase [Candidatus Aminicenantes bacterium]|nr:protein-L-isoaspartate(D-aspartate) O-methyltransferase [Candidatus Aminicenantes bacterium]NIQ66055.1 protein-L-isoaspartate(D-aspartate) O-methyltransferase [Candidatus Aminicenantes bacterium]NIT22048.1 protein-L-isoaspartate(D-aspartate) O-methyltransferase [Candidatus Aminicenantes bacterium]
MKVKTKIKIAVYLLLIMVLFFVNFSSFYGEDEVPDYHTLRKQMVEKQIFSRGITDKRILDAFIKVRRHLFVDSVLRSKAYGDFSLDIGEGQQVSQPYIVAIMTLAVGPEYNKKVLEIGTGSGYHAAILAELVKHVYTIEVFESLAKKAKRRLNSMGYKNITFKIGDGYKGWEQYAPYDGIIVTCHEDHIPQPLIDQLAVGGRMIIPVSYSSTVQELILLEKIDSKGTLKKTNLIPVQALPMIRGSDKK